MAKLEFEAMKGEDSYLCPAAMSARLPVPGILMANSDNIKS